LVFNWVCVRQPEVLKVTTTEYVPQIQEVVKEVPVNVERIVEVPVEVIKEVRVEVPVEKIVEVTKTVEVLRQLKDFESLESLQEFYGEKLDASLKMSAAILT
jgi:ABC-type Mn2+/Zn2+ transport system ATPase subunit